MPDIAAFDFDGTLTAGGSVFGFLAAVAGRRTVLSAGAALSPFIAGAALAGGAVADRTKERLFVRVLAGTDADEAATIAARYGEDHLRRRTRREVRRRLDWHRGRGDSIVVVSASPELYVGPAAAVLGVAGVVATRLEVDERGRLTGRYDGGNCRGAEKLRRLRRWSEESDGAPGRLWAYGNSRGDLAMLRAADIGVDVGRLGRIGRLRTFAGLAETGPAVGGH